MPKFNSEPAQRTRTTWTEPWFWFSSGSVLASLMLVQFWFSARQNFENHLLLYICIILYSDSNWSSLPQSFCNHFWQRSSSDIPRYVWAMACFSVIILNITSFCLVESPSSHVCTRCTWRILSLGPVVMEVWTLLVSKLIEPYISWTRINGDNHPPALDPWLWFEDW